MDDIMTLFYESAGACGLRQITKPVLPAGSGVSYRGTFSTSDDKVEIGFRVNLLFGETVIFIVSHKGKNSPFQLKLPRFATEIEGYPGELDKGAIKRYLGTIVFGPIMRPGVELPALAHLSTGLLLHILSFSEAGDLCSIGLTNKGLGAVSKDDTLWSGLLRAEHPSLPPPFLAVQSGQSARSRYIERHQRRQLEKRRAAERELVRAERYRQLSEMRSEIYLQGPVQPRGHDLDLPPMRLPVGPFLFRASTGAPFLPGLGPHDRDLVQPPWAVQNALTDGFGLPGGLGGADWQPHL